MLGDRLGVSERRACRYVGQHRSTQRHQPKIADEDLELRRLLRAFGEERPRWGYRQAHPRLLDEGWKVNRKRVQRLWREEDLRVPPKARKRRRVGDSTVPAARLRATRANEVWALDFQFDQITAGRIMKLLNAVDEHTREALAMLADRRIDSDRTVATLDESGLTFPRVIISIITHMPDGTARRIAIKTGRPIGGWCWINSQLNAGFLDERWTHTPYLQAAYVVFVDRVPMA
ncbi:MAG: IS3 family transposase [Solirubrobacteraceae bacterium]